MTNRLLLIGIMTALGTAPLFAKAVAQSAPPAVEQGAAPILEQVPPDRPATRPDTKPDPQGHLATAKQLLDAMPTTSLDDDAQKQIARLREDFTGLMTNYPMRAPNATGAAAGLATATQAPPNVIDWKRKFADVERDLTLVLGSKTSLSASQPTAVGTTGIVAPATQPTDSGRVAVPEIGVKNLNPAVRMQLEGFRRSVELFYDATTATAMNPY